LVIEEGTKKMGERDEAVTKIRTTRGLSALVARACGIERAAVYQWDKVPLNRVLEVAKVLQMSCEKVRPDFFREVAIIRRKFQRKRR
jgi:hypothetical protein